MEQSRKHLKITSIILLVFAAATLISVVLELIFGELKNATIPEGSPDNILLITQIFLSAITVLFLAPQVYIGIKGLKVAKAPDASKAHIVWAIILFVLTVIGLVSPVLSIIKLEAISDSISQIISAAIDAVILFVYIKAARAVAKA